MDTFVEEPCMDTEFLMDYAQRMGLVNEHIREFVFIKSKECDYKYWIILFI